MNKRSICFALVFFLLFSLLAISAYADGEIDKAKDRLEDINSQIERNKQEQKALQKKMNSVSSDIEKLDVEMELANSELKEVENTLVQLDQEIVITKGELKEAENNIDEKQGTFNSRLRTMYKNSSIGYLEILFSAKDFKDLLTRIDMIQKIIDHDVSLIKYLKEQRELIESKKVELENKFTEQESVKRRIAVKKQEIEVATRSKEKLMSQLRQNKKSYEKQEDDMLAQAKKVEQEIKRLQTIAKYEGGEMMWPVPGHYRISSPFGYRIHPIFHVRKMHTGIDIPAPTGTSILAANSGKVIFAGYSGGYGNIIIIDHGGGISTLYAHNSRLVAKAGQWVKKGDVISKAGTTGNSTGPHLHFEVRKNGEYTNPLDWVTNN
ncbi:peptidoglycan DD-metalloendopeptidase family protein [Sporosalibacterium faouarense]|uniref:peptidoglycan DD-metalloendopeptidase family protein n=1 Tax=Sporosalibacterium faouarense TaxID=516123 RepID=UPI00141CCE15|nr:peptidase M23 [Bacillota bacterium]